LKPEYLSVFLFFLSIDGALLYVDALRGRLSYIYEPEELNEKYEHIKDRTEAFENVQKAKI